MKKEKQLKGNKRFIIWSEINKLVALLIEVLAVTVIRLSLDIISRETIQLYRTLPGIISSATTLTAAVMYYVVHLFTYCRKAPKSKGDRCWRLLITALETLGIVLSLHAVIYGIDGYAQSFQSYPESVMYFDYRLLLISHSVFVVFIVFGIITFRQGFRKTREEIPLRQITSQRREHSSYFHQYSQQHNQHRRRENQSIFIRRGNGYVINGNIARSTIPGMNNESRIYFRY